MTALNNTTPSTTERLVQLESINAKTLAAIWEALLDIKTLAQQQTDLLRKIAVTQEEQQ